MVSGDLLRRHIYTHYPLDLKYNAFRAPSMLNEIEDLLAINSHVILEVDEVVPNPLLGSPCLLFIR
jgi:hypothetical protein